MGTRGFVGLVVDGTEKISYNQFDSYPSGLGVDTLGWCATLSTERVGDEDQLDHVLRLARALRVIDGQTPPTSAEVRLLRRFADLSVGERRETDWYCLLRQTQGDLGRILESGVLVDASDFALDSLFCEWGYLVDLDAGRFEVYKGFQTEPHQRGRFASRTAPTDVQRTSLTSGNEYRPVALVRSWPLDDLPTEEWFIVELDGAE